MSLNVLDKDFSADERLFHYTSAQGLYGILESDCLWATHFKFLNDSNEFYAARKSLIEFVHREIKNKMTELVGAKKIVLSDGNSLEDVSRHEAETAIGAMYTATLDIADPFIFSSFVSNPSSRSFRNGELLHWATYGRNGGYSLEINPHKLASILPKADILSLRAIYVDDVAPKELSSEYEVIAKVALDIMDGILRGEFESVDVGSGASPFMKVASIIKDGYFRSENEARLVYMRFKKRGDDVFYPDIQIRHRESTSIPYIRLFEGSFLGDRSPLESIIIGPHPDRDRRREALMIYLEGRGLGHIEVLQSEVPYLGG